MAVRALGVRGFRRALGVALATIVLVGCTGVPAGPPLQEDPTAAADRLVAALSAGDVRRAHRA